MTIGIPYLGELLTTKPKSPTTIPFSGTVIHVINILTQIFSTYGGIHLCSETFEITEIGMRSPEKMPVDENGAPKDPMSELKNIATLDGRVNRLFISINHMVCIKKIAKIKKKNYRKVSKIFIR